MLNLVVYIATTKLQRVKITFQHGYILSAVQTESATNSVQLLCIFIFSKHCDFTAPQSTTRNESFNGNIDTLFQPTPQYLQYVFSHINISFVHFLIIKANKMHYFSTSLW